MKKLARTSLLCLCFNLLWIQPASAACSVRAVAENAIFDQAGRLQGNSQWLFVLDEVAGQVQVISCCQRWLCALSLAN